MLQAQALNVENPYACCPQIHDSTCSPIRKRRLRNARPSARFAASSARFRMRSRRRSRMKRRLPTCRHGSSEQSGHERRVETEHGLTLRVPARCARERHHRFRVTVLTFDTGLDPDGREAGGTAGCTAALLMPVSTASPHSRNKRSSITRTGVLRFRPSVSNPSPRTTQTLGHLVIRELR